MFQRRIRSAKRSPYGVASIRRDSYSTINGFNKKNSWWELRNEVWKRDRGLCQSLINGKFCHRPGKEVHHIVPLTSGGTNTKSNLIVLCLDCHNRRHTHLFRR